MSLPEIYFTLSFFKLIVYISLGLTFVGVLILLALWFVDLKKKKIW